MKSSYKLLGNYISEIDKRDTSKKVELLLGVSIQKKFMPSIANIIGTDMSTYKIVKKNQFAYGPVTSRNGDKISIALLQEADEAIISQAYVPFEVIDCKKLNPEYLMMWFRRPEFDRYTRFKSHGSAREIFSWEDMCNVELPIPHPDKQREIVKEYTTILKRIEYNNQLIQKLEETAQSIYKQWFVDFDFPDEDGLPYKSNGGEMKFINELQFEIPKDWGIDKLGSVVDTIGGGTPSTEELNYWHDGTILWYSPTDVTKANSIFTNDTEKKITKLGLQKSSAKIIPAYSLLMTSRATIGALTINSKAASTNQGFITLIPTEKISVFILYNWVKSKLDEIISLASGSTFPEISKSDFRNIDFINPTISVCENYNNLISGIFKNIKLKNEESVLLTKLKYLLLSKLASL